MRKILKKDFDAAVKQPWDSKTCIIAQAMIRIGESTGGRYAYEFALNHGLRLIQREFDKNFDEPGDEKKPELQKLRASLPITIKEAK